MPKNKVYLILDDVRYAIRLSELDANGDQIRLAGTLLRPASQPKVKSPKDGEITSVTNSSSLIRLLHNESLVTAAITHITPKAWRIYNQEWGAAWIPRNEIEWSSASQQFCYIGESPVEFVTDVWTEEWPSGFDPKLLIEECYKD